MHEGINKWFIWYEYVPLNPGNALFLKTVDFTFRVIIDDIINNDVISLCVKCSISYVADGTAINSNGG